MRERAGVFMGNPLFALSCGVAGQVLLFMAYAVWKDGVGPDRFPCPSGRSAPW
ncbi:hypothetical protein ACIRQY_18305 [Streptomyces sp. NPDC101490]|uniref:hypothetical protein n=1 Tax=Streptomyces sp. NPDC101490 TaxID=3366143 RepID=UPI003830F721